MGSLIREIEEVVNAFYQRKDKEGYEKLNGVLGKLMQVNNPLLVEKLMLALSALEKRDTVLLADILNYEIKVLLR